MPFAVGVGVELETATVEQVSGRLAWSAKRCTAGDLLHGGALMSLADSVGAICAYLNLPSGAITSTLSSSTAFMRAGRSGHARTPAPCTSGGRQSSSRSKSETATADRSLRSSRPRRFLPAGNPIDRSATLRNFRSRERSAHRRTSAEAAPVFSDVDRCSQCVSRRFVLARSLVGLETRRGEPRSGLPSSTD